MLFVSMMSYVKSMYRCVRKQVDLQWMRSTGLIQGGLSVSIRITAIMSSPLFSLAVVLQISLEILFPSSTYISEVFKAAPTLTSIPNKLKTDKWMSGTEQHDISWQMLRSTYGLHDHSLKKENLFYAQSQPGAKNCGVATLK